MAAATLIGALGWLVLAAIMIGAGVAFGSFDAGVFARWDRAAVRRFAELRSPLLNDLSLIGTSLAHTFFVIGIAIVILVVLAMRRWWRPFGVLALSLIIEATLYYAVTLAVPRRRPGVEQLEQLRPDASYPSGHSAAAFVLYFSIAVVVGSFTRNQVARRAAWTVVVLAPILVAVSRIYRGMHHPTDVVAGYGMGIGCVLIALLAIRVAGVVSDARADRRANRRVSTDVVGRRMLHQPGT